MLGVDKPASPAFFLRFRDYVQRQRGFPGRFRPEDLDHASARESADTKRYVEPQRTCGNNLHFDELFVLSKPHDGALTEIPLDLAQSSFKGFLLVHAIQI